MIASPTLKSVFCTLYYKICILYFVSTILTPFFFFFFRNLADRWQEGEDRDQISMDEPQYSAGSKDILSDENLW